MFKLEVIEIGLLLNLNKFHIDGEINSFVCCMFSVDCVRSTARTHTSCIKYKL